MAKVTFDGANKLIKITDPTVLSIDVKSDLYTEWKDWLLTDVENAKWESPFLATGGDPLDLAQTQFSPAFFFLQNGWRIKIDTGSEVSFKYNLFTFNPDGIIFNLSNSSSTRSEITFSPSVVTEGSQTDLTEINIKLDQIQAIITAIKLTTDKMVFEDNLILSKLDDASKQTIRDSLAMNLTIGVITQLGSIDNIIGRIDNNTQV